MKQEFTAHANEVEMFAGISGDDNEIHLDEDAASESIFGERVVHGVLALGWVSSMLNDYGDGTSVLLGFEDITFSSPICLGETVEITLEEYGDVGIGFEAMADGERKFYGTALVEQFD